MNTTQSGIQNSKLSCLDLSVGDISGTTLHRGQLRSVHQEGVALHLLDVVEAGASDVAVRERLDASLHFSEDFRRVVATVHRQLPHDPVSVVVVVGVDGGVQTRVTVTVSVGVRRVLEFEARSPAVVQQVLHLLGQVGVRERRQEGEGLEHPVGVGEKGREGRNW